MKIIPVFYYDFSKGCCKKSFCFTNCGQIDIFNCDKSLMIEQKQFTTHHGPGEDGFLDHEKFSLFLKKKYKVDHGEFVFESCIAARQLLDIGKIPPEYFNRIRNIQEDFRLASSALTVTDPDTLIRASVVFTNEAIYALYERFPDNSERAAFASAALLIRRGKYSYGSLSDFWVVGIGIDTHTNSIRWYINREEVFSVPRIGYRLQDEYQINDYGGIDCVSNMKCLELGIGHFTFLDYQMPDNYARQFVQTDVCTGGVEVYRLKTGLAQLLPDDDYKETLPNFFGGHSSIVPDLTFAYTGSDVNKFLFGQGMITKIKYFSAYIKKRNENIRVICEKKRRKSQSY